MLPRKPGGAQCQRSVLTARGASSLLRERTGLSPGYAAGTQPLTLQFDTVEHALLLEILTDHGVGTMIKSH